MHSLFQVTNHYGIMKHRKFWQVNELFQVAHRCVLSIQYAYSRAKTSRNSDVIINEYHNHIKASLRSTPLICCQKCNFLMQSKQKIAPIHTAVWNFNYQIALNSHAFSHNPNSAIVTTFDCRFCNRNHTWIIGGCSQPSRRRSMITSLKNMKAHYITSLSYPIPFLATSLCRQSMQLVKLVISWIGEKSTKLFYDNMSKLNRGKLVITTTYNTVHKIRQTPLQWPHNQCTKDDLQHSQNQC